MKITIPQKILQAFKIFNRCLVLYGGRGSGKSQSVARILLYEAYKNKLRILCCREVQISIADSVHSLLRDIINENEYYQKFFIITENSIKGANGSQFLFKGLKKETAGSIKSLEGVDICWIEEAQFISQYSLDILIPTIRKPNSRIIFTMNPTNDDDPVYETYVKNERIDTVRCEVNFDSNPFFPDVLKNEMEWDRSHNIDKYNHIWQGQTTKHSDAQIFKGKWIVDRFETPEIDFYHGADWGFANDPTALVRTFIKDNNLYIDNEIGGIGVELDDIAKLFEQIETSKKWQIYADSSRPETISHIKRKGFKIDPCDKWQGSVEDGIEFLKNFDKIIIHERCKNTIYEFKNYSYKTDKLTGKITPNIIDKDNHYIDAIRYACNDLIKNKYRVLQSSGISAGSMGL